MKAAYFTRFEADAGGHGGNRRMVQLMESCPHIDWSVFSTEGWSVSGFRRRAVNKLKSSLSERYGDLRYWNPEYVRHVAAWRNKARLLTETAELEPGVKVALIDDPLYMSPLIPWLKGKGVKLVAACHNIESLSKSQVAPGGQLALFEQEIGYFGECDLVVTISREETVLLHNFGAAVHYFPYVPTGDNLKRLSDVRARRRESAKHDFLLLGTAGNPATRDGMLAAMHRWSSGNRVDSASRLLVAGYSTEQLRDSNPDESIEILGQLSSAELDELLVATRACLCYQVHASGALTRIAEMLVAGVPVVANTLAARSYYNLAGVYELPDEEFCQGVIDQLDALDRPFPVPDWGPPDALQKRLIALASQGGRD